MLTIRKVYKAANRIPLGLTKGYTRVNRQERDRQLDPKDFAARLSEWLSAQSGLLTRQKAVRRHWSVEKYHSRRDGAYCEDIRTRRCNHNVMDAMLIARSAAFYFFAESGMANCQKFKERLQANPDEVFRMVTQRTGRKTDDQNQSPCATGHGEDL